MILIHGAGGSAVGNWFANGIAESLHRTNRVIGIDMRGHGLSEAGPPGGRALMPSFRVKNARARELLEWEPAYRDYREGLMR